MGANDDVDPILDNIADVSSSMMVASVTRNLHEPIQISQIVLQEIWRFNENLKAKGGALTERESSRPFLRIWIE